MYAEDERESARRRQAYYRGDAEMKIVVEDHVTDIPGRTEGFVYVVSLEGGPEGSQYNAVKIGATLQSLRRRPGAIVSQLRSKGYTSTHVYSYSTGHYHILERAVHDYLNKLRVKVDFNFNGGTEFFEVSCDEAMVAVAYVESLIVAEKARRGL